MGTPPQARANACTVLPPGETNPLTFPTQSTVEVSTDCNTVFVAPPPPPEPDPEPGETDGQSTWFSAGIDDTYNNNVIEHVDRVDGFVRGTQADFGDGSFKLSVWLNATTANTGTTGGHWSNGNIWFDKSGHGSQGMGMNLRDGRINLHLRDNWTQEIRNNGGTDIRGAGWVYVVLQRIGNDSITLYVNGNQEFQDTYYVSALGGDFSLRDDVSSWVNSDPYLVLGEEKHGYETRDYDGGMFDFCVSSDETPYDGSIPTAPKGLGECDILHWPLDGREAEDISGNASPVNGTYRYDGGVTPSLNVDSPF